MRTTRTGKTLTLHRETLHLLTEIDLVKAAAGFVPTGATQCPVGNTRLCCSLNLACP
jgi:hypothetical protein